jgi:PAS domain S-box-containing protein
MDNKDNFQPSYDVVDNISHAVVVTDIQSKVLFLNSAARNIGQVYDPPLALGVMMVDCVQKQWQDVVKNTIQSVNSTNSPLSFERDYTICGRKIFFDIVCSSIRDSKTDVNRIMFEFRDITLQKIHENRTSLIVNDLTKLIETINALIIGIDIGGFIIEWNNYAEDLTGYSKSEALARHFTELFVNVKSQDILFRIISETMTGHVVSNRELPVITKSLQRLNLLINATCRKNADMEIVGVTVTGLDITELTDYKKSLEEKVRERTDALERAMDKEKELVEVKKRFVSIASHEFRAPISIIKLQIEALKKLVDTTEQTDIITRLNRVHDQADHMSVLLEDILLIGKADAGKITANIENIELKSLLDSIVADVEQAAHKSHHIEFAFLGPSLHAHTDKNILRNILVNLLSNAIKFSPNRDRIYFDVVCNDQLIEFTILDEGIGISESEISKIFEPFNRASNAKCIGGTGLGLSIVKKAVATLNGRIWVESKLNIGSKFTVQLKSKTC